MAFNVFFELKPHWIILYTFPRLKVTDTNNCNNPNPNRNNNNTSSSSSSYSWKQWWLFWFIFSLKETTERLYSHTQGRNDFCVFLLRKWIFRTIINSDEANVYSSGLQWWKKKYYFDTYLIFPNDLRIHKIFLIWQSQQSSYVFSQTYSAHIWPRRSPLVYKGNIYKGNIWAFQDSQNPGGDLEIWDIFGRAIWSLKVNANRVLILSSASFENKII